MSDLPPILAELARPDDSVSFAALVELMDSLGCRFIVKSPDNLGTDGAALPAWCSAVIATWFDVIVSAYVGVASGHELYACAECCFPMLLLRSRRGRACPSCDTKGAMTYRLPIHFVDPPPRRQPVPRPQREEAPPEAPSDPVPSDQESWSACGHSLVTRRVDDTYRCSYCNTEAAP